MRKKLILGTILSLSLAITFAVIAVAPALANLGNPPAPNVEYVYGTGGYVVLNLPQGSSVHPTVLKIGFQDIDRRSTKGAEDALEVSLWIPASNRFSATAFIDDNPVAVDSLTKMFAGTSIMPILVNPTDLDVWTESTWTYNGRWDYSNTETTIVNLTKPVAINYPPGPNQALSYTLPPLTLKFIKTGEVYEKTETTLPLPSGWKSTHIKWNEPAWAIVQIPSWIGSSGGGTEIPTAAVLNARYNIVNVIPS
jgi:hypothetical protein